MRRHGGEGSATAAIGVLTNVRYWILAALAAGLLVGPLGDASSALLTVSLIVMMSFSLDGLEFRREDLGSNGRGMVLSILGCFGVSLLMTLAVGFPFAASHPEIWKGWILLACMPAAVSVVTATLILGGNTKLSVLGLTSVYLVSLVATPLLTYLLLGSAADPMQILRYVLLFIALPFLLSFPVKRLRVPRVPRSIVINAAFFVLIFTAFGSNRDFFFSEPALMAALAGATLLRLALITFPTDRILRRRGTGKDSRMVYVFMAFWKNSGMAAAMSFLLFENAQTALPSVMAVVVDMIWFIFILWYYGEREGDPAA
ncbi:MAG: hypothetical protein RBQ77_04925 [Candidatus Methanomethylophilaceae archaeon]|nr:hypothetical protein [Candidatus Methanomethylophilaceae archaeon]